MQIWKLDDKNQSKRIENSRLQTEMIPSLGYSWLLSGKNEHLSTAENFT